MENLFCLVCKKNAEFKKINQINVISYFCKKCIIEKKGATKTNDAKAKCDNCFKKSNYIVMRQDNRVKKCCENCLLRNYRPI